MKRGKLLSVSVSALALGLTAGMSSGALAQSSDEDNACARALSVNTVEAIEAFLNQYPGGTGGAACRVLAQSPQVEIGGNDGNDGNEDFGDENDGEENDGDENDGNEGDNDGNEGDNDGNEGENDGGDFGDNDGGRNGGENNGGESNGGDNNGGDFGDGDSEPD